MKVRLVVLVVLSALAMLLVASAASPTPNPTSVTVAGDLQSEAGCPGDWDPACATTHLTYDSSDDVWQGTFSLPAGSYQYKAALNNAWDENYGLHAVENGSNIPVSAPGGAVKFYYDHKTHWATDNKSSTIATAVGDFQSELGCPADWSPDCLRSWLEDPDGDGTYTFQTTALPAGSYNAKVALNESWDVNYGAGGVPGGDNIPFTVPSDHAATTFSYDSTTHVMTVSVADPQGAPGALSHFDLARKDCFGTARNTTSKVWFTVAGGVLSDVYYPTIDNTNVETLRYVVTDGSTFTDVQGRDSTYTVAPIAGSGGMGCRIVTTANSGKWSITMDYVTDPAQNALLMKVRFSASGLYKLYARFDPTVNGNGGGGGGNGGADSALTDTSTGHPVLVADDPVTTTNAANRDYAQPIYAALDAPFSSDITNGFAGTASDGLVELDASHALTTSYATANNGNVVQTARIAGKSVRGGDKSLSFTVALGFGSTQAGAVATAESALGDGFDAAGDSFKSGWQAYDAELKAPPKSLPGISGARINELKDRYWVSANVLKAVEDKTFPGALVAAPASPWGQAISAGDPANTYFGSYREVFARDLYEIWSGLMADGDTATARDATLFLFNRQQQPDGSMPRNSLVNGKTAPDSFNTQLDEAAYPLLMADELHMTDPSLYENHVKPAANFVAAHGPNFGVERWEEQDGYSPSTIAAEIAGLVAAADLADANHDTASAALWRGTADDFQRSIKGWTVTTTGPLAPRYFIRLSKTGDPNAAISYNVGNGGPTLDQRQVIDAGFLELSRLGELPATDPDILASLPVVDGQIKETTSAGPGWHRYNGDGYGDRDSDGRPWAPSGQGSGHLWPALTAERAEQQLQLDDSVGAASLLNSMAHMASGVGLIPEQNWENPDLAASPFGTDPTVGSIGFTNGGGAGSAAPLDWSAGSFVRLARDLAMGKLLDRPDSTYSRYVLHTQGTTALSVSSPADQSAISGSPVTVTGTSTAGNTVYVAATNTDNTFTTHTASALVGAGGTFSIPVDVDGGTTALTTVAVSPSGGTAHDRRAVVFDFVPGTLLLDVPDPNNDDNGPGNYAYPTNGAFHAGAFDLQDFQVYDSGPDVTFRVKTRDLTPTFGPTNGAQLIDVYVHVPGASSTSTSASNASRNFSIDPSFAWSRLLQVQGFGQRYEDATGHTLGTIGISANQISHYITFKVSKASLGTPTSGWSFTVVLHGQDGFSSDQARGFQPTPQDFQFGVCAAASGDPHCTFAPGSVPKLMDVLTPAGVNQATELDYTLGPVVLKGVAIP